MSLCWQHCDEYLKYRIGLGLSINSTKGYVFDLSRYLKDNYNDKENLIKDMVMPWCVQRESEKMYLVFFGRKSIFNIKLL